MEYNNIINKLLIINEKIAYKKGRQRRFIPTSMAKEGYGTAGGKAAAAAAACNPNWASLQEKLKGRKPLVSLASLDNGTRATSALGKRKERPDTVPAAPLSTPSILAPTSEDFSLTEALAMDCEMVGVSFQGNKSALGRVSLREAAPTGEVAGTAADGGVRLFREQRLAGRKFSGKPGTRAG
ncbi:hypothetical protein MA16_Dca002733 [Dendrobium catenatum]|uniref:Uncharacterized protein n=1 Tax=Dendrobium catenatum TaxID=906689 RepID=A0A2I0X8K8_9ASPA|nr:hypothetical protein MA16_Dca002733 [Dendrobium catenatum]